MKYYFIKMGACIVLAIIFFLIAEITDRDLILDYGLLYSSLFFAGNGLADVCFCTSMFRKNMGTGLKKILIILVSIACLILVIYSIYCLMVNRDIHWIGCEIAFVLALATAALFYHELREIGKTNFDGKNIEDM